MVYCGSYSFLKDQLVKRLKDIYRENPFSHITFIVHTNSMRVFLKRYIADKIGFLANAEFFTLIDISKKITGIEPLQDFDKEMIFRKVLYEKGIPLDGLPEEFNLLTQQLGEYEIPLENIQEDWIRDTVKRYALFKEKYEYYDREDVHRLAIEEDTDYSTDYIFIFGIKSVPSLHKKLLRKVKSLGKDISVFLPFYLDSGIYGHYPHFKDVLDFYEDLTGCFAETEKTEDKNLSVSKQILHIKKNQVENENIRIFSAANPVKEIEKVASYISQELLDEPFDNILLVIPEGDDYKHAVKEVFQEYMIPCIFQEEESYISKLLYRKLFSVFLIKEENFSKEAVLNVLPVLDLKDQTETEFLIKDAPAVKNFQDWELFLFPDLEKTLKEFLTLLNSFKDKEPLEIFLEKVEKIVFFLKDEPLKDFLKETLKTLKEEKLYKDLFHEIEYKHFVSLIRSFFEKPVKAEKKGGVSVLSPISAEANNSRYIFFVGLNSGRYPSVIGENVLFDTSTLNGFSYPYHILMQEVLTFSSLFDRGKTVILSYSKTDNSGNPVSSSFLIEEIKHIAGKKEIEIKSVYPNRKTFFRDFPHLLLEKDASFRYLYRKLKRENSLEDYKYDFVSLNFPLSATEFQMYVQCPFIFFVKSVLNIEEKRVENRTYVSPIETGNLIHDLLKDFYKSLKEDNYQSLIEKLERQFQEKVSHFLLYIFPSYRPFEKKKMDTLLQRLKTFLAVDIERLRKEGKTVFKEYLEKEVKNEIFKGRIDRADIDREGNVYIYDYKTGKVKKPEKEIISKYIQLLIYAELIERPVKEVGIISINDEKGRFFYSITEHTQYIPEVYRYLGFLKKKLFPPVENETCRYCYLEKFCKKIKAEEIRWQI